MISTLKHSVAIETMAHQAATTLGANEIGYVNLSLDRPLVCEAYRDEPRSRQLHSHRCRQPPHGGGGNDRFLAAPRDQYQVADAGRRQIGAGPPEATAALRALVHRTERRRANRSIANLLDKRLSDLGRHTTLLDGDNLRHGVNRDLGFSNEARVENIRRVAEIAALFVDAGMIALVSLISPFRSEREMARGRLGAGEFIEIHVATPLDECERRDPKGLYRRARAGELPNFTGIDQPYEAPQAPELVIDTSVLSAEAACERIVGYLQERHYL